MATEKDLDLDNIDVEPVVSSGLPNFTPAARVNTAAAESVEVQLTAPEAISEPAVALDAEPKGDTTPEATAPFGIQPDEMAHHSAVDTPEDGKAELPKATVVEVEQAAPQADSAIPAGDVNVTVAGSEPARVFEEELARDPIRSYAGILLEHGADNYQHRPDEKQSYYVTFQTPDGPETIWGVDLERALAESGAQRGDPLKLDHMGNDPVQVDKILRDANGNVTGTQLIDTTRAKWEANKITSAELDRIESAKAVAKLVPDALTATSDAPSARQPARADEAIEAVADRVRAKASGLNPDALAQFSAALEEPQTPTRPAGTIPGAGPTRGQEQVRTGAEALIEGGASLIGGAASLTGSVLKGVGKGAASLASALKPREREPQVDADFNDTPVLDAPGGEKQVGTSPPAALSESVAPDPVVDPVASEPLTPAGGVDLADAKAQPDAQVQASAASEPSGVTVLPRLSEYRVEQVERAASKYEEASEKFWSSHKMPLIRQEIESRAEAAGITPQELMGKIKPNGEYAELHEKFVNAVSGSPEAQIAKKQMDKALDGWAKQYGRAQEELLNPETEGNPHYDKLKEQLDGSSKKMHDNAADVPAFEGEQSHLDKLKDVMERIAERLKEMVQKVAKFVSRPFTKGAEAGSADHAPAP